MVFSDVVGCVLLEFFNIQDRRYERLKEYFFSSPVRNTNIDSCLSSSLLLFLFDVEQGELIKNHIGILSFFFHS